MITLIRPPNVTAKGTFSSAVIPSMGLAYISAVLKEHNYDVTVIDSVGEGINQIAVDENMGVQTLGLKNYQIVNRIPKHTTFIGISSMFSVQWPFLKLLIMEINQAYPEVPIILGGEHASAVADFILKTTNEVTICVHGEGEQTLLELIEQRKSLGSIKGISYRDSHGQVVRNLARHREKELDKIPWPDWESIPLENYFASHFSWSPLESSSSRSMLIMASRGCPYKCTFCSNDQMWTTAYYTRSVLNVILEMEHYKKNYSCQHFDFTDLTAIFHRQWIIEFCELLISRKSNITWSFPVGARSETFDREVLNLMKLSGCTYIHLSPESGSKAVLKRIKKRLNKKKMLKSIALAKKIGLPVRSNFIIGFPFERRKDVWHTLIFQWQMAFCGARDSVIHYFSPYPGSELFDELTEEKIIPEIDHKYFSKLMSYMNMQSFEHYCQHISKLELALYRLIGMAGFYGISYLLFPIRAIVSINAVFIRKKGTTVLEQRIIENRRKKELCLN